jgi:hypothetical protein
MLPQADVFMQSFSFPLPRRRLSLPLLPFDPLLEPLIFIPLFLHTSIASLYRIIWQGMFHFLVPSRAKSARKTLWITRSRFSDSNLLARV